MLGPVTPPALSIDQMGWGLPQPSVGQLRHDLGLTQRQLCAMLGCNRSSLIRWERGCAVRPCWHPLLAALRRIADQGGAKSLHIILATAAASGATQAWAADWRSRVLTSARS